MTARFAVGVVYHRVFDRERLEADSTKAGLILMKEPHFLLPCDSPALESHSLGLDRRRHLDRRGGFAMIGRTVPGGIAQRLPSGYLVRRWCFPGCNSEGALQIGPAPPIQPDGGQTVEMSRGHQL